MKNKTEMVAFADAVTLTVAAVKEPFEAKDIPTALAVLRSKMFNESFLEKGQRQAMLKEVNDALGSNFTMNQVRKADPTLLNKELDAAKPQEAEKPHQEPKFQVVDELHGSVELPSGRVIENNPDLIEATNKFGVNDARTKLTATMIQLKMDTITDEEHTIKIVEFINQLDPLLSHSFFDLPAMLNDLPNLQEQFYRGIGKSQELLESYNAYLLEPKTPAAEPAPTVAPAPTEVETPTVAPSNNAPSLSSLENTMTNAKSNTQANNKTLEEQTDDFIAVLSAKGHVGDSARDSLYNAFLQAHPDFGKHAAAASQKHTGANNDQQFFAFFTSNKDAGSAFAEFADNFKQSAEAALVEPVRSRFSFTGDGESGIRSSWVAAVAAVIGAGLETMRTGELTIGSGVGALAGVGGAFLAGEYIDSNIESSLGRYSAASAVGIVLGGLGGTVGRMAEGGIAGMIQSRSDTPEVMVTVPAMQIPSFTTTTAAPAAASQSIQGFIAGF